MGLADLRRARQPHAERSLRRSGCSGRRTVLAVALLFSAGPVTACGDDESTTSASVEPAPDPDPVLAGLPRPAEAVSRAFVGESGRGATSLAVSIGGASGHEVVAYLCDGIEPGVWFTGRLDETGSIEAASTTGEQLTATLGSGALSGTIGDTAFELEPAEPGAGLFRQTAVIDAATYVSGWIVHNDARVVGTTVDSGNGAVVGGSTGDDADGAPSTPSGGDAVPASLGNTLACSVNGFRRGRLIALANQHMAATGSRSSPFDQRIADVVASGDVLGCGSVAS